MAPEAAVKLPIIDFTLEDLKPGTPTWDSVKIEVTKALQDVGCFIVLYDKIPMEIRKAVFESTENLFDLPLQTKAKHCRTTLFQGYNYNPGNESVIADELELPKSVESFTGVMWPQGNSKFSKTMQFYLDNLQELGKTVRKMVLESLGLEKYMDEHMEHSTDLLQFSKYAGPQSTEDTLALRDHSDKGILGILSQNETNGLEIQTKDGQWIEVNYPPNSFLVLPGDVFHAWTNGRLYSPVHRVIMNGNETRYTVGFFSNVKPGFIVKVPEEIVDAQHPLLYKPFDPFAFLAYYFTKAGQNSEFPLRDYCGISHAS